MCWQPGQTLESVEKDTIEKAFRFYQQNKTKTAQSLQCSVRTLDAKLEKYANSPIATHHAGNFASDPAPAGRDPHILHEHQTQIDESEVREVQEKLSHPEPGLHVESHEKATQKPPVPVRKPKEV